VSAIADKASVGRRTAPRKRGMAAWRHGCRSRSAAPIAPLCLYRAVSLPPRQRALERLHRQYGESAQLSVRRLWCRAVPPIGGRKQLHRPERFSTRDTAYLEHIAWYRPTVSSMKSLMALSVASVCICTCCKSASAVSEPHRPIQFCTAIGYTVHCCNARLEHMLMM